MADNSWNGTHAVYDPFTDQGHITNWYGDGYRQSTDIPPEDVPLGEWHWTNENVAKGNANRHTPPSDADDRKKYP